MNQKKTGLTAIIIAVSAMVLGLILVRLCGQEKQDNRDEIHNITPMDPSAELTTESTAEPTPEKGIEPVPESDRETDEEQKQLSEEGQQPEEEQPEKQVRVVEDEEIRNNPVFAAFIDKEIPACDEEGKGRYIYEYYADYARIEHIHYMAEDLNQDTRNELLIYIEKTWGYADLLVFEEKEGGELIVWKEWTFITSDRRPDLYYCGDGKFMIDGVGGVFVEQYTQEKVPEPLMEYYQSLEDTNDAYYMLDILLILFEDGEIVKELEYERYCDMETHKDIVEWESEEAREGEKIANEILAALGEGRKLSVDDTECCDETEMILLRELQSP